MDGGAAATAGAPSQPIAAHRARPLIDITDVYHAGRALDGRRSPPKEPPPTYGASSSALWTQPYAKTLTR
jgi:hypothetical protein